MNRSDFRFFHRLRVRWAETDAQGIVFNGHYLTFFDVALTEYWRAVGFPYPSTVERLGVDMFAVKAGAEYHAPARYDDELDIGVRVERIGNSSIRFVLGVFREGEHLTSGEVVNVTADAQTRKPQTVPEPLREAIRAAEGRAL